MTAGTRVGAADVEVRELRRTFRVAERDAGLVAALGPVAVLAAAALAALLVVLTRLLWQIGLRHYSGASA